MKFRKKPVVIEATQFFPEVKPWPEGVVERESSPNPLDRGKTIFWIETLEGGHVVTPGDWIITGVKGAWDFLVMYGRRHGWDHKKAPDVLRLTRLLRRVFNEGVAEGMRRADATREERHGAA